MEEISVCLFVSLCLSLSVCLSVCLSVSLSLPLSLSFPGLIIITIEYSTVWTFPASHVRS